MSMAMWLHNGKKTLIRWQLVQQVFEPLVKSWYQFRSFDQYPFLSGESDDFEFIPSNTDCIFSTPAEPSAVTP